MKKYILTIDIGTTSTRAILVNKKGDMEAVSQIELDLFCPHDGWVEQNPQEIWLKVKQTILNVLKKADAKASDIGGIAITNQRETTILWNKNYGNILYNALVWQSRQSQDICDKLIEEGYKDYILEKTGLVINSYFSASKIRWIIDNVPGVLQSIERGEVYFGNVDTYVLWNLTNHEVHKTDYSNASRTMLYNIYNLTWDEDLLKLFGINKNILPEVCDSNSIFGYATGLSDIDEGFKDVPIASILGDQQASLFGQCCFEKGSAKNTYGTGCFMLMNTKEAVKKPEHGLLSTIAWSLDGKVEYALEGSVFIGGCAIQWLRDQLEFIKSSGDCENFLHGENPSGNVIIVPAFVGMGTPYWDSDARGAIFGLTRVSNKKNMVAATVESIAYQCVDVLLAMEKTSGIKIKDMGVDGGACVNNYLMQFQSNLLDVNLLRPINKETTALGTTYVAGLKVGFFKDINEIKNLHQVDNVFSPIIDNEKREKLINNWHQAVKATLTYK